MDRVGKWRLLLAGVVVFVALALAAVPLTVAALRWLITKPNVAFDGRSMEAVVARVRAQGVPAPGGRFELRLARLGDPESLRARRPEDNVRGREVGNVWALRAETGELTVIVETVDNGHAGRGGYVYSEKPPEREANGRYEVGGEESDYLGCTDAGHQVADHWWEAWNCEMD